MRAQTAEDYFHRGAQFYVFGEKPKARTEVKTGLQEFPDDPKLLHLAGLLEKNEEENQQQPPSRDKQNDEKNQQEPQKQQPKPDSKDQEQQQQPQNQQENTDKQKQPEQAKENKPEGGDKGDGTSGEQTDANAAPGRMTVQQAQQLLESTKGEERAMIFVPAQKLKERKRTFKDW